MNHGHRPTYGSRAEPKNTHPQMCAGDELEFLVPRRVAALFRADDGHRPAGQRPAFANPIPLRRARRVGPESASSGPPTNFLETWKSEAKERNTLRNRVIKRDLGYCQAPGCSRRAAHVHHVEFRSHGGADSMENEIALYAAHHLVAIHEGYMRVTGKAPDQLVWEIGLKPPRPEDVPDENNQEWTACQ